MVDSIHSPSSDHSEFSSIIMDCHSILYLNPFFGVSYVRRQTNIVVHSLARMVIFWYSLQVFEFLTSCIFYSFGII